MQSTRKGGRPVSYPNGCERCTILLAAEDVQAIDVLAMGQGISRSRWLRQAVTAALKAAGVEPATRMDMPTPRQRIRPPMR